MEVKKIGGEVETARARVGKTESPSLFITLLDKTSTSASYCKVLFCKNQVASLHFHGISILAVLPVILPVLPLLLRSLMVYSIQSNFIMV